MQPSSFRRFLGPAPGNWLVGAWKRCFRTPARGSAKWGEIHRFPLGLRRVGVGFGLLERSVVQQPLPSHS